MSLWKTKALEAIRVGGHNPDLLRFERVRSANSAMELMSELYFAFEDAHREPPDLKFIKAVYDYADWCLGGESRADDAGHDAPTAAGLCFFEHLPTNRLVRARIGEHLSRSAVIGLEMFFRYLITDDDFAALLVEVDETSKRAAEQRRKDRHAPNKVHAEKRLEGGCVPSRRRQDE